MQQTSENSVQRNTLASVAVLSLGFLSVILYCYLFSRHRIFWLDEFFGWTLITDPDWHHMLAVWRAGGDGGGVGFYVGCRLWLDLLGKTALNFRLFSAVSFFLALSGTWFALRRFYPVAISAFVIVLVWFGSHTILYQMIQGRFYGMLLAGAAWALFAAARSADESTRRSGNIAMTFIGNAVLVVAHTFGVFYSAAILFASVISDRRRGYRRPWFYAAAVLPWSLLAFSLQAIINSAKVGKPWYWTKRPHLGDLFRMYVPDAFHSALGALVSLVVLGLIVASRPSLRAGFRERSALLFPAIALALVPLLVWLISQRGTSYFVDRYFLPFTLGVAVLLAEALFQIFSAWTNHAMARVSFAVLATVTLAFVAWFAIVKFPRETPIPPHDFTPRLAQLVPPDMPVVFEDMDVFGMMEMGRTPIRNAVYLLSWPIATAPDTPRGFVSNFHEMTTWREFGYYASSVRDYDAFFASTQRFAVVDCNCAPAFDRLVLGRPGWTATRIGELDEKGFPRTIWLMSNEGNASPSR